MAEYIEREEAIAWFMPYVHAGESIEADVVISDLKGMKAYDVEPVKRGRWIEYTKVIIPQPYNKWEQAWKCSECGFDDGFVAYNYCPNCGARMDLDGHDEA